MSGKNKHSLHLLFLLRGRTARYLIYWFKILQRIWMIRASSDGMTLYFFEHAYPVERDSSEIQAALTL